MNKKQMKWILASQAWYFQSALPYSKNLPFDQPPIDFKKCLKWYRKAKKWHDAINDAADIKTKATLPPPPPPPPPED